MGESVDKASEYRKQAAACLDMAARISLQTDRIRVVEIARRWLELAQQAESKNQAALFKPGTLGPHAD
jgi:hypothetical protein